MMLRMQLLEIFLAVNYILKWLLIFAEGDNYILNFSSFLCCYLDFTPTSLEMSYSYFSDLNYT